jgi:hypothetical protein
MYGRRFRVHRLIWHEQTRKDTLAEYQRQLKVINDLIDPSEGMLSLRRRDHASGCYCLPRLSLRFLPAGLTFPPLPPKLKLGFTVREKDPALKKVYDEVRRCSWEERTLGYNLERRSP